MIYADVTELVHNPIRSGIQRVAREFIAGGVADCRWKACYFDKQRFDLVELPKEAVELLIERHADARALPSAEISRRVNDILGTSDKLLVPHADTHVVVPELFFDPMRAHHLLWRNKQQGACVSLIICDFIPWLRPEMINVDRAGPLMSYLRLTMECRHAAFISRQTYDDWRLRIVREPTRPGTVLSLGADGLGLEHTNFDPRKRDVVCLGSIDGRKNQDVIARAFERLWEKNVDLNLVLVGYSFNPESEPAREVRRIAARWPRLRHVTGASDAEVREILRGARATIYMSQIEGYGLPPVESLHAGIPVVVADGIPSISDLPADGQIRIASITEATIEAALVRIADDRQVFGLWRGAQALKLPTWADFRRSAREWLG